MTALTVTILGLFGQNYGQVPDLGVCGGRGGASLRPRGQSNNSRGGRPPELQYIMGIKGYKVKFLI